MYFKFFILVFIAAIFINVQNTRILKKIKPNKTLKKLTEPCHWQYDLWKDKGRFLLDLKKFFN